MSETVSISMLPARDGDCLFVETAGFRLLIDGGRSETGREKLPVFLSSMPARPGKPAIDLMILTHVDADHIAGLLTFLAALGSITIGEVWFNGFAHHKRAADIFIKPARSANTTDPKLTGTLSVDQALDFDRRINALRIPWNTRLNGETIMVLDGSPLPRIPLAPGLSLVLLGPPKQKIAKFYPEWEKCVRDLEVAKVLRGEPRIAPTVENLRQLATQEQIADNTKPNGASIVFVLEAGKKRILFAADAHPGDVANALERYDGKGRVFFHAVKVAHHGSAKNNTPTLIDKLRSPCWLVSTDGTGHRHPDAPAIARIILAPDEDKRLIFNYRSNANNEWDQDELKEKFRYSTCFGDGQSAITVCV